MYEYKIRFRNWVRDKLQAEIRANQHDRAFLEKCPWLTQLLPLGSYLYDPKDSHDRKGNNHIKVQKVDTELLLERPSKDVYFINADGEILTKVREHIQGYYFTIREAELIYKAFERLGDMMSTVKHIVVIDHAAFFFSRRADITVYNFPKGETQTGFVIRLIAESQDKERKRKIDALRQKELNYEQGKVEVEEMVK